MQRVCFHYNHQTPMLWYASYLKSVYTQKKLPIYDKWPQVKSKKYINLALIEKEDITKPEADLFTRATIHGKIDDIVKSKRSIDIDQVAQVSDGSQVKCILVEGAAGVGKSTFAWKLCRKWGRGKLLQQYQLVVLLRLRDKSVRAAKTTSDFFQYHNHQIQEAAVKEIQDTGGNGVLLLFEGYDELPEELRSEKSVFLNVITGRELPQTTVLITSRPWATEFLHRECKEHISQHIEILGFTKNNIQSYLETAIPNDPSLLADLQKYISFNPHINSLMYIPLNSAIVVEVYRNSRKDETLVPKTMTELYSSLVRSLLLRYLLDHPVHGKKRRWKICSFNDLPQDIFHQLCELGRIAYKGILHDQQVIFSDLPEDFETLGLMHCSPELYVDEGTTVSYNFLHLTVQEYLAAFHLSQQPVEGQIELLQEYKEQHLYYHKQHLHMMLLFLCGIRKFSAYPVNALNTLCYGDDSASIVHEIAFNTLHWLFEAQDNDVITNLLGSSDIQLRRQFNKISPFDCFVLGYCVSHSNCTWKIDLRHHHIETERVELLVRGTLEGETHCMGGISELNLSKNALTSEGVKHLLKFPKQLISKMETLNLEDNKLDSESNATLSHLIPHTPHLNSLKLSHNLIGKGAALLLASLTVLNALEHLSLSCIVGAEDCKALSELLASSTSLKELGISLAPQAVELIISEFHLNTTLRKLDMENSNISFQNTTSLASVLRTNHTLIFLGLGHCNIDSDGACQLADALCTNDTLQTLYMNSNPVGVNGATAFAKMLRTNHALVELNLGQCNIDSDGACELASSLCTNNTLQTLCLDNSPFGINGVIAFVEMIRTNHSLVELNVGQCNIDSDGACQLANALGMNNTLRKLHLQNNPIGVKGATMFAKMLKTNCTLVFLHLGQCNIDSNGACQLASALCTNGTLQKLRLWLNPIEVKGATAFAEMLPVNKALKVLSLRDNSIGEEGIWALIESLSHNTTVTKLWLSDKYSSSIASAKVDSRVIFYPIPPV